VREVQGPNDSTIPYSYSNGKNQRDSFNYDAAGNFTNDTTQIYAYNATGQTDVRDMELSSYTPTFTDDQIPAVRTPLLSRQIQSNKF